MSNTRKVLACLKQGFNSVGEFTCAPINWAAGKYDKSSFSENSPSFCCCSAVECIGKCIVRTPPAIVASAFTCPVGITAGTILGAAGSVVLTGAAVSDIPEVCCPPARPSMSR